MRAVGSNWEKWKGAQDSIKAPFIAERISKHIELYRLLESRGTWIDASEIAQHLACSRRHVRRLLDGFAIAGYIDLERGDARGSTLPTQARIKKGSNHDSDPRLRHRQ